MILHLLFIQSSDVYCNATYDKVQQKYCIQNRYTFMDFVQAFLYNKKACPKHSSLGQANYFSITPYYIFARKLSSTSADKSTADKQRVFSFLYLAAMGVQSMD